MRTDHSLKISIVPFPDGSYLVECSYWVPVEDHFELVGNRAMAPDYEAVAHVIKGFLPFATYEHKPRKESALI